MKKVLLLMLSFFCAATLSAQFTMAEQFASETIAGTSGETLPARVWRHYSPKDLPVPVVVLLHGSGECGTDNVKHLASFEAVYKNALISKDLPPALYIIPQCTVRNAWVRMIAFKDTYRQPRYPAPALRIVKEHLDSLIEQGIADPDRLYISGFSLGGFGTWDAIQRWPNYFAAAIPLCGGGSIQEEPIKNAATTSIWIVHGEVDPTVSVECAKRMVQALSAIDAAPHYTEYAKTGHVIWPRAYNDSNILKWMFEQRRGKPDTVSSGSGFFGRLKAYITPGD